MPIGDALLAHGVDPAGCHAIEFTFEELFTNIVKYNPDGAGEIELELEVHIAELVGRICDPDSERFDVTSTPDADLDALAEQHRPGGLGLHLIRRLVDSVEYDYSGRRSLVVFRRTRQQT